LRYRCRTAADLTDTGFKGFAGAGSAAGCRCPGQKLFYLVSRVSIGAAAELARQFNIFSVCNNVLKFLFSQKNQTALKTLTAAVAIKTDILSGCDLNIKTVQNNIQKVLRPAVFLQNAGDR
jgi:hypothetical protein